MPQLSGLLFALLCVILGYLLWAGRAANSGGRAPGPISLALASAIPPLMIVVMLMLSAFDADRFGDLRLSLLGFDIAAQESGGGGPDVFRAGGDAGKDDLIVKDSDSGLVRISREGDGFQIRYQANPHAPGMGNFASVAAVKPEGGAAMFAGDRPLNDGDVVCLSNCSRPDAPRFVFRAWQNRFEQQDGPAKGATLPRRKISGISGAPWTPTQAVYPLRYYLPATSGEQGICATLACTGAGADRGPARSFLFQRAGWLGMFGVRWFIVAIDPGAEINGKPATSGAANLQQLAPGQSAQVAIYDARTARDNATGIRGYLVERRSFTASAVPAPDSGAARLRIRLTTPDMQPIGRCEHAATRLASHPAPDDFGAVRFANLGSMDRAGSAAAAALGELPIPRAVLCRGMGGIVTAGDSGHALVLRLDRMAAPFFLAVLACAWSLVFHLASRKCWATNRLDWTLSTLMLFLLALRIVMGMEGVIADPSLDWRSLYAEVGIAYVVLPFALTAARRKSESGLADYLILAGVAAIAVIGVQLWIGHKPDGNAFTLMLLGAASFAVRIAILVPLDPRPWLGRAAARWPRLRRPRWLAFPTQAQSWLIFLCLLAAGRWVLGGLGMKERVFGVAISLVYLPALIIAFACITTAAAAAPPARRLLIASGMLVAFAAAALLAPKLVSDNGFVLVHAFPLAVVIAWQTRAWKERSEGRTAMLARRAFVAPAIALPVLVIAFVGFVAFSATPTPPPLAPGAASEQTVEREHRELESLLGRAASESSNDLRIIALVNPAHIRENGGREAEELRLVLADLDDRTDTYFGQGYMQPSRLGNLTDVHLSDNISAVHLMSPFGRAGALAFLLVLMAAAANATNQNQPKGKRVRDWGSVAGMMAVWTLFAAAAYMVFANLQMIPFTGRNIYLLAASSGSDLLEGFVLFLIARLGLEKRKGASA